MSSKKEMSFLIQVCLPFIFLSWWKSTLFLLPVGLILLSLPFSNLRVKLIKGWQAFGEILGKVISPVVLSVIYYLVLTPLALLRRLGASDPLKLKRPLKSPLTSAPLENSKECFEDLW